MLTVLFGVLISSCANIVKPSGGPKDETGPKVIFAEPANRSLNFEGKEVKFRFDEFLKAGNYSKEVFISPFLENQPEVIVKNKTLIIRFRDDLAPNTTYVLNIGKGIKDFNEGNEMASPITFAFSTGNKLDSLFFRGKVGDPWTGKGKKDVKLLLFPADSVFNHDIEGKKPLYVAQSDENGSFNFLFLRQQRYKLYGLVDLDDSYSYNQPTEGLAILEDPVIDLFDSSATDKTYNLTYFVPDQVGPDVKGVKWLRPGTFHIEFKEPVYDRYGEEQLSLFISDTSGTNLKQLTDYQFINKSKRNLLVPVDWPDTVPAKVYIRQINDSLGNSSDTIMNLTPGSESQLLEKKLFFKPEFDPVTQSIVVQSVFPFDTFPNWDTVFTIKDTLAPRLPFSVKFKPPYQAVIRPMFKPIPKMPYTFSIGSGFRFNTFELEDTLIAQKINLPLHEEFGSVQGKIIPDSADPADMKYNLLLFSKGGGKEGEKLERKLVGVRNFKLDWLKPGKYKVVIVKDKDGNGAWTPGSLNPYKLPEEIYIDPQQLEIRANWDLEDYTVTPVTRPANVGKGKLGK